MAAAGSLELRRSFADFLLGAEVSDSYTLDDFRQFFPAKYRDHSDVKILYEAFQMKRKKIRELVKRNIRRHCSRTSLDTTEHKVVSNAEEKLVKLEEREEALRQELASIEEEMAAVREQSNSCLQTLEDAEWFHGLHQKDFNLNKAQELASIEEEMAAVMEQSNSCLQTLEDAEWFHGLHQKDFNLNKAQELSEQFGINIS